MEAIALKDWNSLLQALTPLYQRYARWLPAAVDVLLALVIARLLAALVWALVPAPAGSWQPAPVAAAAADPASRIDLNRIGAAQLFGEYKAPANPGLQALTNAPDSNLPLTLLGILANGHNKASSRALISNGTDEKPYAIDDAVVPGAVLTAIFPDRIVVSRNGQLETIRLDKTQPSSGAPPIAVAENVAEGAAQSLAQIRAQMLANPAKAQDYIRVQPAPSPNGSGQMGYRIYPGKDRAVFNDAGLRPGDVVTSINGVSLDDPAKSLQLLSDLSNASQVSLTIQRGGETQTVNVNLSQ